MSNQKYQEMLTLTEQDVFFSQTGWFYTSCHRKTIE